MMQTIAYNGWNCVRLAAGNLELLITRDVGPRVIRCGVPGGANLFAEIAGEQGGRGETEWRIRGGHRLWVAPEGRPWSYEPDNVPVPAVEEIAGGVRFEQAPGAITQIAKRLEVTLDPATHRATLRHTLVNCGQAAVTCAPWALSVMAPGGEAIIPLPPRIGHAERLTPNQNWSLWGYTDLTDPRWRIGSRYLFFRHDAGRGPSKLGLAHREGWVAYLLRRTLFVKTFTFDEKAVYPDHGCNFETFGAEAFLELESLGALTTLPPGGSVSHVETWRVFDGVPPCRTEDDADRLIRPLAAQV